MAKGEEVASPRYRFGVESAAPAVPNVKRRRGWGCTNFLSLIKRMLASPELHDDKIDRLRKGLSLRLFPGLL